MAKKKIIIGVHGLNNKPPRKLLEHWWRLAIREGFSKMSYAKKSFRFELVYWACLLYPKPLHPGKKDPKHPLYIENPYLPSLLTAQEIDDIKKKDGFFKSLERGISHLLSDESSFFNTSKISDYILRALFYDLNTYYHGEVKAILKTKDTPKELIRKQLIKSLLKHQDKDIFLIGHSMGSIIAYDTLLHNPDLKIHTLATMGSPLGLPVIRKKIEEELASKLKHDSILSTPNNISNAWINYADPDDKVSTVHSIKEYFKENTQGVCPQDTFIFNDYEHNVEVNAHKSYGYLRSPEAAHDLYKFLEADQMNMLERLWKIFD